MKKDIHPKYYETTVKCACGNTFTVGSTSETLDIEVCSQCHPFYTGKSKKLDIAGRVNKFEKRATKAKEIKAAKPEKKVRAKKTTTKKVQKIGVK
jgi:large subunit ribosomal protein L31